MNRFERFPEPDRAEKQSSLYHLVRWASMICAAGIVLACAVGAIAILSDSNFKGIGKSWSHLQQTAQLTADPKTPVLPAADLKAADAKPAESKPTDSQAADPKADPPKMDSPKSDIAQSDVAKSDAAKTDMAKANFQVPDPQTPDPKGADAKATDPKAADPQTPDPKAVDSSAPENATAETKTAEASPEPSAPLSPPPPAPAAADTSAQSSSMTQTAENVDKAKAAGRAGDPLPTLSVDQLINGRPRKSTSFHLSVNADGVVPDHSLIAVHGLPKGTTLSAGHSDGVGGWFLAPDDLSSGLAIVPGSEAVDGPSELVVQLLTPEGRVANETHAKLIISGGIEASANTINVADSSNRAPLPSSSQQPPAVAAGSPEEIQALLSHGRDLERVGYFAGARLFFQRAVEAGSAEGARAMGDTYDPATFEKLNVHGMTPDPAMARKWYDRAKELEAQHPDNRPTRTAE